MKRVLLVFPHFEERHHALSNADKLERGVQKAFMAPISIATFAAMTPPGFTVELWDENIHG